MKTNKKIMIFSFLMWALPKLLLYLMLVATKSIPIQSMANYSTLYSTYLLLSQEGVWVAIIILFVRLIDNNSWIYSIIIGITSYCINIIYTLILVRPKIFRPDRSIINILICVIIGVIVGNIIFKRGKKKETIGSV
jgi:hypothetical protein